MKIIFEWDENKDVENIKKHDVSFYEAQSAFLDPGRLLFPDAAHSEREKRFFCVGKIERGICTVRYTRRENKIRIIGAGFWRKGKGAYEKENRLHG